MTASESEQASPGSERRSEVLDAALRMFARFGYRKTSMDDIAQEARISRPGLYFLFASKGGLFGAAAERAVGLDLLAAESALAEEGPSLADRVVEAFDCWAGRYIGPLRDTTTLIEDNPGLLGPTVRAAPTTFETLVTAALERSERFPDSSVMARTLISVSIGLKHQATNRDEYRSRMADAARLLMRSE